MGRPRKIAGGFFFVLTVSAAGFWLHQRLSSFMPEEKARPLLEKAFGDFLKRPLAIESLSWGLKPRPVLIGKNVRLFESDGRLMALSPRVNSSVSFRELLRKKIEITEIQFVRPEGTFRRRADGGVNLAAMIREIRDAVFHPKTPAPNPPPFNFRRFTVKEGTFHIIDEKLKPSPFASVLKIDALGDIEGPRGRRRFPFHLKARVISPGGRGSLEIKGRLGDGSRVEISSRDFPLSFLGDPIPLFTGNNGALAFTARWSRIPDLWEFSGTSERPAISGAEVDQLTFSGKKTAGGNAVLHVKAAGAQWKGKPMRDISLRLTRTPTGEIRLDEARAEAFGGRVTAEGNLKGKTYTLSWKAMGVNMADVQHGLGSADIGSGRLTADGVVEGNPARGLKGLRGVVHAELRDGALYGAPGLLSSLTMFNLHTFLKKVRGLTDEGFIFTVAKATVTFENGLLTIDPPAMVESHTLHAAFSGTVDIANKTVDARLVLHILTAFGEAVGAVPGVRTILLDGEKNFVPLWVRVSGPLSAPKITPLAGKSVTDSLWGAARRALGLPARWVNFFRKME